MPVKVKAKGQDEKVLTYAFLDSRSNTSLCTDTLLSKLNAKGVKTTLSLTTMQTTDEIMKMIMIMIMMIFLSKQGAHLALQLSVGPLLT